MLNLIPRNPNLNVDLNERFEPGVFSIPELHFLLEHLQDEPIVAFHEFDPEGAHKGVMRVRIEPMLTLFGELETLRQKRDVPWAGYDALSDSISRFILWHDRCQEIKRRSRGRIANASQYMWDDTGRPWKFAIDADCAEFVRTEILDSGDRKAFGVPLQLRPEDALSESLTDVLPWVTGKSGVVKADKLIEGSKDKKLGFFECSVCGHRQEFRLTDRGQKAGARARMARHMRTAKDEQNRHQLLHTKTFRSASN